MTPVYPVELVGERVVVREYRADDFASIRLYAEDPEVHRHTIWQPDQPEDTVRWLREVGERAREVPRSVFELAVAMRGTDEQVGGVALRVRAGSVGGLGYVLRRDRWGRGLATEAARLVVGFGFERLGLTRVFAMVDPQNLASVRVLCKLGMRREGLLRRHEWLAGRLRDVLVYGVLVEEWS